MGQEEIQGALEKQGEVAGEEGGAKSRIVTLDSMSTSKPK